MCRSFPDENWVWTESNYFEVIQALPPASKAAHVANYSLYGVLITSVGSAVYGCACPYILTKNMSIVWGVQPCIPRDCRYPMTVGTARSTLPSPASEVNDRLTSKAYVDCDSLDCNAASGLNRTRMVRCSGIVWLLDLIR